MLTLVIKKVFKRHDDLNISVAMRVNNAQKDLSDSSIRKKKKMKSKIIIITKPETIIIIKLKK